MWAIAITFRPSDNISHFNLLLRNHWANCNQTLVEWSMDGPLPNLCLVILTSNQDGHQACMVGMAIGHIFGRFKCDLLSKYA
jgi:hypothetical protein